MISEEFLKDNGFSNKASSSANVYIKDMAKIIKAEGDLHAHIKLTLNPARTEFEIHGTVRTQRDAEALGKGSEDEATRERTVGRAIWVFANGTIRSPVEQAFWIKNSGTTLSGLKAYCRKLHKEVKDWTAQLQSEGGTRSDSQELNNQKIDHIGLWVDTNNKEATPRATPE